MPPLLEDLTKTFPDILEFRESACRFRLVILATTNFDGNHKLNITKALALASGRLQYCRHYGVIRKFRESAKGSQELIHVFSKFCGI